MSSKNNQKITKFGKYRLVPSFSFFNSSFVSNKGTEILYYQPKFGIQIFL